MSDWKLLTNPSPPPSPEPKETVEEPVSTPEKKRQKLDEDENAAGNKIGGCEDDEDVFVPEDEFCKFNSLEGAYFCKACDATMNSDQTYLTHISGKRHQKKVSALRYMNEPRIIAPPPDGNIQQFRFAGGPILFPTRQVEEPARMQAKVAEVKEPVIGLNYITEIWRMDEKQDPVYHCSLCPADCQMTAIISHIVGFKHRMAYMKLKRPEMHQSVNNTVDKKSRLTDLVSRYAGRIESEDGRGSMIVEVEVPSTDAAKAENSKDAPRNTGKVLTAAEKEILKKEVKNLPPVEKLNFLLLAAENILYTDLEHQSVQEEGRKKLRDMYGKLKEKYIKSILSSADLAKKQKALKELFSGNPDLINDLLHFKPGKVGMFTEPVLKIMAERNQL